MDDKYKNLIAKEFRDCVDRTINRITQSNQTYRPFHKALLSEDVIFWSAFERSFSTSFGQRVIEKLAELVALSNGAEATKRQKITIINIDAAYEEAIHDHIQNLRSKNKAVSTSWNLTVNNILKSHTTGQLKQIRIISDMWWKKDGINNYISLKTVKPNIDQTAVAKEDCLHLTIADPNCRTYFGLPYNPYGKNRQDYAFSPPMRIFDFINDPVVLIGKDMWDTIGGTGCYEVLLDIACKVGKETRDIIKKIRR